LGVQVAAQVDVGSAAPGHAGIASALTIAADRTAFSTGEPIIIRGRATLPPLSVVTVTIDGASSATVVDLNGSWEVTWPSPLGAGSHEVTVAASADVGPATATSTIVVGRLPRRPLDVEPALRSGVEPLRPEDYQAVTDRWRLVPPPYELNAEPSRWDPYNQNILKGDLPIPGHRNLFFVLTGVVNTLVEARTLPTPSGASSTEPAITFFGGERQQFVDQGLFLTAELFHGLTAYRPIDWRLRATLAADFNYLRLQENGGVNPDVREGRTRTDSNLNLQELFGEVKLADLSPSFDFLSLRAGIQPFNSDFRGFVFSDTNLGLRLFGNYASNRYQYNLALFDRLEKDTNSGLNLLERREQQVAVLNVFRQDTPVGHTVELSVHYVRDQPSFAFDENGFLARPDPVGDFTPHEVTAWYFGYAGAGHFGRFNLDSALYYVTGDDTLNPIAGRQLVNGPDGFFYREAVDIRAGMAAVELSWDRDWIRPKIAAFYATGDDDLNDRHAEGFEAIFDNPNFAGGGFSFWNRLGIRLAGTGVTLVNRGSLLPDLRTSKDEGQLNFVNPGLQLVSLGVDLDLTPKLRVVATGNYLRFDHTEVLEGLLFQSGIDREIGVDLSVGARWRPLLNQNLVVVGGVAGLLPGRGFDQIYDDPGTLVQAFANVILTF
jgi:hypothetical protein